MTVHELLAKFRGAWEVADVNLEVMLHRLERSGFVPKAEVEFEERYELVFRRRVVREAIWIFEDAAAYHETVDLWIFFVEGEGGGAVFDVAVDNEFGVRRDFGTESYKVGNEFIMRGDFGHFFTRAEMDGERGRVFSEKCRKPFFILIDKGET